MIKSFLFFNKMIAYKKSKKTNYILSSFYDEFENVKNYSKKTFPYKKIDRSNKEKIHYFMKIPSNVYIENKHISTNTIFERTLYMTPLATVHLQCKIGAKRTLNILQNQIMYDIKTLQYIAQKNKTIHDFIVNPRFLEYMMGFPIDWTKV